MSSFYFFLLIVSLQGLKFPSDRTVSCDPSQEKELDFAWKTLTKAPKTIDLQLNSVTSRGVHQIQSLIRSGVWVNINQHQITGHLRCNIFQEDTCVQIWFLLLFSNRTLTKMVYKEILPIRIASLTFPPYFVFNRDRKGPYDAYRGTKTCDTFNQLFQVAKVNVTMVESKETGYCYSNGTCTGIFELLRTKQADFSMFSLAVDFSPELNVSSNYPVNVGPRNGEFEAALLSMPRHPAYKVNSDILSTVESISWYLFLIQLMTFICIWFLFNVSFENSRYTKVILKGRISAMQMYAIYMKQLLRSFKQPHRFVAMATLLIYSMLFTIIYNGSISADMVAEYPPRYYLSLEELLENFLPGHNPVLFKGLEVDSDLVHRDDATFQLLGRVSQRITSIDFETAAQKLLDNSAFVEEIINIHTVRAYICVFHSGETSFDLLRQLSPVFSTLRHMLFRPSIATDLKMRMVRTMNSYAESGIQDELQKKMRNIEVFAPAEAERQAYHRCYLRNSLMKEPSASSSDLSYSHFNRSFVALGLTYALFTAVFFFEVVHGQSVRLRKRRNHKKRRAFIS